MASPQLHEDLAREDDVVGPSDRSVGVVFAAVFAVVGAWPLMAGGAARWWALALAAAFAATAAFKPALLAPLNRVWLRLGLLLHRVVNPLIMGLIFVFGVVPFGLGARLFGKELLRLGIEPDAKTYWIERKPPGPAPDTMRNQY